MMLRRVGLALGFVVPVFAVACGGSDNGGGGSKSSGSGMIGQVSQAINKLEQDIKSPSGVVTADSAKGVLAQGASQNAATDAFNMGGAFGGGSGQPGSWIGVPPGFQPQGEGAGASACIAQTASTIDIDLGCLGKEKGVDASGKISMGYEQDAGATYVTFKYAQACVTSADAGQKVCIDGNGAMKMTQQGDMAFWADMTVDKGGQTEHMKFGYKQTYANGTLSLEYVAYVGDDSYVLGAKLSSSEGSISVKGKNGEYTCSYSNGGASGQCSGSGGETFNWGDGSGSGGGDVPPEG